MIALQFSESEVYECNYTSVYAKNIKIIISTKKGRRQKMSNILKGLKKVDGKKTGIFAAGVLFGTAGIKVLSSKDAKKLYTNCTAAVLRAKECVLKTAATIQENAEDVYAEAQQINEDRAAKEEQEYAEAQAAAETEEAETADETDFAEEA